MALAFPAVTAGATGTDGLLRGRLELAGRGAADGRTSRSVASATPGGGPRRVTSFTTAAWRRSNSASANRRREQTRSSGRSTGRLGKGAGSISRSGSVKRSGSVLAPGRDISPGYADED